MYMLNENISMTEYEKLKSKLYESEVILCGIREGLISVGELLQVADLDSVTNEAKLGIGSLLLSMQYALDKAIDIRADKIK